MNIAIIDADLIGRSKHRFPNLACMKLSGYYKSLGHNVQLITDYTFLFKENHNKIEEALKKDIQIYDINSKELEFDLEYYKKESINRNAVFDKVFISKVFSDTPIPKQILLESNAIYGGTGFFYDKALPLVNEIEHHMPDYHLYDNWVQEMISKGKKEKEFIYYNDYSIGFTTRGCFRQCEFCVNKNYKKVELHSPVEEFLDNSRKYICLLDDNILGFGQWESIVDKLIETKKPFQYKQGIDLRLITEKKAEKFSKVKYKDKFIFAFDSINDRDLIEKKLSIWKKYNKKQCKLYVLCAYDSQDSQDIINTFERIKILMKYGSLPYIMRYKEYEDSEYRGMYINLARWCNQPNFFEKKSFREYCEANGTNSSTYKYMQEFESKHPDIAKEYFDLKYEQLNMYK